jgi:hypothetical protein
MTEPGYYAIIPANVRYDGDLIPLARLLYGEITALCNQSGFCWAENKYFAELYGKHEKTISKWISQLEKNGYITVFVDVKKGNTRKITLVTKTLLPSNENATRVVTKTLLPSNENATPNIRYNNTINNTVNKGALAFQFLKEKCAYRLETDFLMKFKSQIKDFPAFVENFNDTAEQEQLEFNPSVLIPRIRKYGRAWINNQNKFKTPEDLTSNEKRTNPNNGIAI